MGALLTDNVPILWLTRTRVWQVALQEGAAQTLGWLTVCKPLESRGCLGTHDCARVADQRAKGKHVLPCASSPSNPGHVAAHTHTHTASCNGEALHGADRVE